MALFLVTYRLRVFLSVSTGESWGHLHRTVRRRLVEAAPSPSLKAVVQPSPHTDRSLTHRDDARCGNGGAMAL